MSVCLPIYIICALPESIFSIALVSLSILTTKGYSFMYFASLFAFCVAVKLLHASDRSLAGLQMINLMKSVIFTERF